MAERPVVPRRWTALSPAQDPGLPGGQLIAGMWRRAGAYLLDGFVLTVLILVIVAIMEAMGLWFSRTPNRARPLGFDYNYPVVLLDTMLGLIVSALYFAGSWRVMRATPGQLAFRLRVCAVKGGRLTPSQALRRWLALGVPLIPVILLIPAVWLNNVAVGLGILWAIELAVTAANHRLRRGLHDRYAGSLVVRPN